MGKGAGAAGEDDLWPLWVETGERCWFKRSARLAEPVIGSVNWHGSVGAVGWEVGFKGCGAEAEARLSARCLALGGRKRRQRPHLHSTFAVKHHVTQHTIRLGNVSMLTMELANTRTHRKTR
jgi:hypothetical protein